MSPDVGTGRICHIIKIIGKERGFYGMTKEEAVIRSILGPVRSEIRTFACAVGITVHLLFDERMSQDDIRVTKHVYPEVAKRTGKSYASVSRKLERMGNLCWDNLGEEGRRTYIGRQLRVSARPGICFFIWLFTAILTDLIMRCWRKCRNCCFREGRSRKVQKKNFVVRIFNSELF